MRTPHEVGAAIRDWRKSQRLSQEKLGELLGCSQGYVSMIERGEAFSNLELLCSIADQMDISLDELVGRDRSTSASDYAENARPLHQMLEIILATPPNDRARLLEFIEQYSTEE